MAVKKIPEGYHTVTPYLLVTGAANLIEFLKKAFNAIETASSKRPDGKIGNAEIKIGDSMIMVADVWENSPSLPSCLYLYVPDTDALYKQAMAAGGISLMEPADQFYGDRNAGIKDPAGNTWWIATHVEDVSAEELQQRMDAHKKA